MALTANSLRLSLLLASLAAACSAPALAQNWFGAPRVLTEGGQALAAGDLDHDGDTDVLLFQFPATVLPLLNDGAGDFAPGTPFALDPAVNLGYDKPVLADLDGDGWLDLAVTRTVASGSNAIALARGIGGAAFAAPVLLPLPGAPFQIEAGDFDADGQSDLAVFLWSSTLEVGWIRHDGAQFSLTATLAAPAWTKLAYDFAVLDLDLDGRDDVAFSELSGNVVRTVLSTGGALSEGPTYAIGTASTAAVGLAAGDLDGDGNADLLACHRPGVQSGELALVPLLAGPSGVAVGLPQTLDSTNLYFPLDLTDLGLADIDGDGDPDIGGPIQFATQSQIGPAFTMVENLGGAVFGAHSSVAVPTFGRGAGFADFDGDGRLDACANDTIVFGNGTLLSPLAPDLPAGISVAQHRAVDLDGDGDVDLVGSGSALLNDGTAAFAATDSLLPAAPAGFVFREALTRGDFDGDGRLDFLAELWTPFVIPHVPPEFVEMRLIRDDHSGHYVDAGAAAPAGVRIGGNAALVGDFDGDGDQDVLDATGLASNDGSGFFQPPAALLAGVPSDSGDVDADGDLDVLATNGNSLLLHRKLPGLSWSSEVVLQKNQLLPGARLLDVDEDGDLDAVAPTAHPFYPTVALAALDVVANTAGALAPAATLPIGAAAAAHLGTGDVDGDGLSDLLAAPATGNWVVALRRSGGGFAFAAPRRYVSNGTAAFADADADGDLDPIGVAVLEARVFEGPAAGVIRQYGAGKPGSGGATPILGAQGPAKVGSATYELRLRRAVGGAPSFLLVGPVEAALPNLPLLGMTLYVGVPFALVAFPASGAPGGIGDGALTVSVVPPASLLGVSIYHQTWHADAGALFGAAASNGLEVTFGS